MIASDCVSECATPPASVQSRRGTCARDRGFEQLPSPRGTLHALEWLTQQQQIADLNRDARAGSAAPTRGGEGDLNAGYRLSDRVRVQTDRPHARAGVGSNAERAGRGDAMDGAQPAPVTRSTCAIGETSDCRPSRRLTGAVVNGTP